MNIKTKRWIEYTGVRLAILIVLHSVLFSAVLWTAYLLRFDLVIPDHRFREFTSSVGLIVIGKMLVFHFAGHFHGWYKYVTFSDLVSLIRAATISLLVVVAIDYFTIENQIPRSVILLDFLLTIVSVGLLRSVWRLYDERTYLTFKNGKNNNAILIGHNAAYAKLAHQINSQENLGLRVKALVAPGTHRRGARLGNVRIAGTLEKLESIARKHNCQEVLVPNDILTGPQLRSMMEKCNLAGLRVRILPQLDEVLRGGTKIPLRELDICDLLNRESAQLDSERIACTVAGKRILVTGAGGSIGSEICRQLIKFSPAEIILLGRGENRIFQIELELRGKSGKTKLTQVIADITDEVVMRSAFEKYAPEIIFHAAAHKHVPLMERHAAEAVRNNAHGTRVVADLACEFGVERFVLVSSDKAVNPTSVMGCSKQLAERILNARAGGPTLFCVVRFGNVLGSNGSVIPIFQEQIRNGGPITITDSEMTRFFMSIPEASQLVLQAGSMCTGGEVFCLEMGKPIRITDLAKDLIRLSGLPADSIDIVYTGARVGEKLYEELYFSEETTIETDHAKVRAAYQRPFDGVDVDAFVDDVIGARNTLSNEQLKDMLKEIIPEYHRPEPVKEDASIVRSHTAPR